MSHQVDIATGGSTALAKAKASVAIFIAATLVLIIGIIQDVRKGRAFSSDIVARRFLGFFVATLLLLMLAQPAPKLAKAFAITMAIAVVVADNGDVLDSVRKGLAPLAPEKQIIGNNGIGYPKKSDKQIINRGTVGYPK